MSISNVRYSWDIKEVHRIASVVTMVSRQAFVELSRRQQVKSSMAVRMIIQ